MPLLLEGMTSSPFGSTFELNCHSQIVWRCLVAVLMDSPRNTHRNALAMRRGVTGRERGTRGTVVVVNKQAAGWFEFTLSKRKAGLPKMVMVSVCGCSRLPKWYVGAPQQRRAHSQSLTLHLMTIV